MAPGDSIGDGKRSSITDGICWRETMEEKHKLRAENFNLKLRLSFIEEHMSEIKLPDKQQKMVHQLTDLQVYVEELKKDIENKKEVLKEAAEAMCKMEQRMEDDKLKNEQIMDQLKQRIECLELDRETDLSHNATLMDELRNREIPEENINALQKARELEAMIPMFKKEIEVLQSLAVVNKETLTEQRKTITQQEDMIRKLVFEKNELAGMAENIEKHGHYRERFLQTLRHEHTNVVKEKQTLEKTLKATQKSLRELMSVPPKELSDKTVQVDQCLQDAECMCRLDENGSSPNPLEISQLEFTIGRMETTIGKLESTIGELQAKIARLTYERNHILQFADNLEEQFITNENRLETYRSAYTNLRNEYITLCEQLQISRDKLRQGESKKKTCDQEIQTLVDEVNPCDVPDALHHTVAYTCTTVERTDDQQIHCECVALKTDFKKEGRFFRSLIKKLKTNREGSSLIVNEGTIYNTNSRPLFESVTSGKRFPLEFQYKVKENTCSCNRSCLSSYQCTCNTTSYVSEQPTTGEGHPKGGENSMCSCPCHRCCAARAHSDPQSQYNTHRSDSSSSLYVSASSSTSVPKSTSSTERNLGQSLNRYYYPVDGCIRENTKFERI